PPDSPVQGPVSHILQAGRRAADLVAQLLTFSRKQIIEPQVLDLAAVITRMSHMLRRIIGEDIHMETILPPDLWPVKVDPARIEQVIVNLAVNARDAMPEGGQLTIDLANVVLDDDYADRHLEAKPGEYVMLAVSDTGVGMSRETQARSFEPFFTTKETGKGTGLGLSTIFGIVKQSGGDIRVYSEEGQGSTFKIYLPVAAAEEVAAAESLRGGELRGGAETVLLVEDETAVRELASTVLRTQGYTVLQAADGAEALRVAGEYGAKIDLLLTDVIMPRMGGKELADRLVKARPGLKVLFTSGYTGNAIVHHGVLEPDLAFLQKPFSAVALARAVRQTLDE
ncbi:MAG: ATP-binding protein, partial [Anaerolineae bacterium]